MCVACNHTGVTETPVTDLGWKLGGKTYDGRYWWTNNRHGWSYTNTANPMVVRPCHCRKEAPHGPHAAKT
jgi:hypothetical protein